MIAEMELGRKAKVQTDEHLLSDSLSNKKIKKCIEIKYFSEDENTKSYTEVADKMNVTVQTIINWHNKFIKTVRQKCKNRKIIFDLV